MKISPRQYAKLLYEETEGLKESSLDVAIGKVVSVIRDNRDQKKLEKIVDEFSKIYKEKEGVLEGEIVSAKELDAKKIAAAQKIVAEKYEVPGKNVRLTNRVDISIKGGLIIRLNGDVWDGSLKSKIEKLKSSLEK